MFLVTWYIGAQRKHVKGGHSFKKSSTLRFFHPVTFQEPSVSESSMFKTVDSGCPNTTDWVKQDNLKACYHFMEVEYNWLMAHQQCHLLGASLAMIMTAAEGDYLYSYIQAGSQYS